MKQFKSDDLGNRMKEQYENRTRIFLPRRTYTILRLDQKCGHSYTAKLDKPFDKGYIEDLNQAVKNILPEIHGAKLAYVQSDEISILLTDFNEIHTQAWFDANLQKMVSVSASLLTAEFNKIRLKRLYDIDKKELDKLAKFSNNIEYFKMNWSDISLAHFDARVFTIPDRIEVMNYFIWRNNDCSRNSVSMVAQANFSHKELQGKSSAEMQEMLFQQKQINWSELPEDWKNGRVIVKDEFCIKIPPEKRTNSPTRIAFLPLPPNSGWEILPAWKFTQDKNLLLNLIPEYPI